jgi:SpoVK/Ycf46/Vps4 family AAA+-type ATPase
LDIKVEMSQFDYIKDIAKHGLENDQAKLLMVLNELIEHSKKTKKVNFAIQLQSILRDALRQNQIGTLQKVGSSNYFNKLDDKETEDLILERLTSDYKFDNLIGSPKVLDELSQFINEHRNADILRQYDLPIANKVLLHGPSGCGKTLASYVIAGELEKLMIVVNLGTIVSSKLGETSKNLAKIFRKAALEDCIVFIDEFDSVGKVRDYNQDHGEMKRVVNTILQLFDYLPQSSIVIAATNQKGMLDDALIRRFDTIIDFELPTKSNIKDLIKLTLRNGNFKLDGKISETKLITDAEGLSYYSIQKTLITAIKRSLLLLPKNKMPATAKINTLTWQDLLLQEKKAMLK